MVIIDVSGQPSGPIFRDQAVQEWKLATFRDSLAVPSSGIKQSKNGN